MFYSSGKAQEKLEQTARLKEIKVEHYKNLESCLMLTDGVLLFYDKCKDDLEPLKDVITKCNSTSKENKVKLKLIEAWNDLPF